MISNLQADKTTDPKYVKSSEDISDSIASLEWNSLDPSLLACSSWDKKVSIYQVRYETQANLVAPVLKLQRVFFTETEHPCVTLSWRNSPGVCQLLAGSIDGTLYAIDYTNNQMTTIRAHNDAITQLFGLGGNLAISISLDKECKIWDLHSNSQLSSFHFPATVACADFRSPFLALAFSNQKTCILKMNHLLPGRIQWQNVLCPSPFGDESFINSISLSIDNRVSFGTLDGRGNISSFINLENGMPETYKIQSTLTFKAHKLDHGQGGNQTLRQIMFPIHSVDFHPRNDKTMITAGGDGDIHFWDTQKKMKTKSLCWFGIPVTKAKFSPDGAFLAYGLGYDWSKGIEGAHSFKNILCVHEIQPNELSPGN